MTCGCRIVDSLAGPYIKHCQCHSSAEAMLRALKDLTPSHRAPGCWCEHYRDVENQGHSAQCIQAREAIAAAEPKGDKQ